MKTRIIKTTAMLMMVMLTVSAFAKGKGTTETTMSLNSNHEVELNIGGSTASNFEVKVYNDNGFLVFDETLSNSGNQKVNHDITDFPEGIYTYQVIDGDDVIYQARVVKSSNNSVELRDLPGNTVASISEPATDRVLVRLESKPGAKTRIRVTDIFGDVLYTKQINNVESARITHDISEFPAGRYNFSVYSGNELIAYRLIEK